MPSDPPSPPLTVRPRLRLDVSPLRTSRDFRLVMASGGVSLVGSMVTFVAVPFQVKELTGSVAAVGLLGIAELVPLVVFGLWGGALADSLDRRRMVLLSEAAMCGLSALLLANSLLPRPMLWPLYVLVGLLAACNGVQRPSLDALLPRMVTYRQIPAAMALSTLGYQLGSIAGPTVGGLLVTGPGMPAAYGFDVATFVGSLFFLVRIKARPPAEGTEGASLRSILVGVRYARGRPELVGTYLVDIAATFLAMPMALYPFVADELNAPWALGLLYASTSVGSLLATLTSGWVSRVHRHGQAVLWAAGSWGAAVVGFGFARSVWLAVGFLVLAGAADMVSGLFRMAIWNQTIPDELRGRLAGIELLGYETGPTLGQGRAGLVGALTSPRVSAVSGGVLCVVAVGVLALALPSFRRYDERTNPHAVQERERRAKG